jgi:lipopolysaccharide transport system permease protein
MPSVEPTVASAKTEVTIDADNVQKQYLLDLFRYRELFFFFALRDILVRYKQAFFGVTWALIRPVLNMILFTLIFSRIANLPSGNVNYALFVLAGMLPWQLFSSCLLDTSNSLINHSNLVSKVYFPRMIIPSAQIIVHLLDMAIGLVLLTCCSLWLGAINSWTIATLPFFLGLSFILCIGTGLWLSALTVKYRDFRFIVPFVVQFGIFLSPVGYGSFMIPGQWIWIYMLNPLVGIIDGFRWAFFGLTYPFLTYSILISIVMTMLILTSGYYYFRQMEKTLADRI